MQQIVENTIFIHKEMISMPLEKGSMEPYDIDIPTNRLKYIERKIKEVEEYIKDLGGNVTDRCDLSSDVLMRIFINEEIKEKIIKKFKSVTIKKPNLIVDLTM